MIRHIHIHDAGSTTSWGSFSFRGKLYHRVKAVRQASASKWLVTTINGEYEVEGGKAFGGTSKDWFIKGPHYTGPANGLQDALNLLENL